jgi:threonine dehydrogenase-like Zn-dependent dehydrogenase
MRAVITRSGSVGIEEIENPTGDSILTVAQTGICGSDLHMIDEGMAPVAIGHEIGAYLADGSLAAVRPTGDCGVCDPCQRGFQASCRATRGTSYGIAVNGGLADYISVEEQRVFRMLPGARPQDAALVEPLAVSWHGVRRVNPEKGTTALVVGAGSIGLLAVAALRARGLDVDIVSRHAHQSAAAEALGARVIEKPKPYSYLSTFDAVCNQQTIDMCVSACMPGGKVGEFGMFWGDTKFTNAWLFKEVSMIPAMAYSHAEDHDDFRESADHLALNPHVADAVVTHTFSLDDAVEAFRVARDRKSGAIKVQIHP